MGFIRKVRRKVIGLAGGKGVGKDTVAEHLRDIYGFTSVAFADPVRAGAAAVFGVAPAVFLDPETKEVPQGCLLGHTPRRILQTLGTEWGRRTVHDTLWVDLMLSRLGKEAVYGNHLIVIPDVRFDDEAKMVRAVGGEVWCIARPDVPYGADSHASERGISPSLIDRTLHNNMDKRTLFTQVGVALTNYDRKILQPD